MMHAHTVSIKLCYLAQRRFGCVYVPLLPLAV